MGNKPVTYISNATDADAVVEIWEAGQRQHRACVTVPAQQSHPVPTARFGADRAVIVRVPAQQAYHVLPPGRAVLLRNFPREQHLTLSTAQQGSLWEAEEEGEEVGQKAGMKWAGKLADVVAEAGEGTVRTAVTSAVRAAGGGPISAAAAGYLAGGMAGMMAKSLFEEEPAEEEECLEQQLGRVSDLRLQKHAVRQIKACISNVWRSILFEYLPLKDADSKDEHLLSMVQGYIQVFTSNSQSGMLAYLETVHDEDSLTTYIIGASVHLLLLEELHCLLEESAQARRAALRQALRSYAALYMRRAESLWTSVRSHRSKKLSRRICAKHCGWRVEYSVLDNKQVVHQLCRRGGKAVTVVSQYEVGRFIQLESSLGKKLPEYDAKDDAAAERILDAVNEAQRVAKAEMKDTAGGGIAGKKRRKMLNDDEDDAELKVETRMKQKRMKLKESAATGASGGGTGGRKKKKKH